MKRNVFADIRHHAGCSEVARKIFYPDPGAKHARETRHPTEEGLGVTATSSSCGDTDKPPSLRTGCKCARVASSPAVGWSGLGGVGGGAGLFLAGVRVLIARIGAGEKRSKREWRSSQKKLSNWLRSRDASRGFAKACSTSCRMMSPRDNDVVRITDWG